MTFSRIWACTLLGLSVLACPLCAQQQPPSYSKQVRPFLAKFCLECHSAEKAKGELNLESMKSLLQGGKNGAVLVPGQPERSRLVLLVEGKEKPAMPPKKAIQPKDEERALLRAWIAAGAKIDEGNLPIAVPDIKPRVKVDAPIAALAYHPSGRWLAGGGRKEVVLLDPNQGDVLGRLPGQDGNVTALAVSRDGRTLAVASGSPGKAGVVRLVAVPENGLPNEKPTYVLAGHTDIVHTLAWSPDGKILASAGYDRSIALWDASSGKAIRTLKDHSDTIHGLAFNNDGNLLASAAADRAVKVWEVATGKRLYTLGESTDWLYALAWSPDGKHLAAAGVDQSIRIWETTPKQGKLVHSVFAHEAPVTRLVYSIDGKVLYSVGEDRVPKAWDSATMAERKTYPKQSETVLSLALRPDQKQLAVGRYDGVLVLLDVATGQVQAQPLPAKPKPPSLSSIMPKALRRGTIVRLQFSGKLLDTVTEVHVPFPGAVAKILAEGKTADSLMVEVTFPAETPAGVYQVGLKNAVGASATLPLNVDLFASQDEKEPNDAPSTGQKITLPTTIVGALGRVGDVDYFRFEASAGQQVGVQALTSVLGSKVDPVLQLLDSNGKVLAESNSGVLGATCAKAGVHVLGIRDREYRGGVGMDYRLQVGDVPVITSVFPLGLQRGTETPIQVDGVHLGNVHSVRVKAPADAAPGTLLPLSVQTPKGTPLGGRSVRVDEFPEVLLPVNASTPAPMLAVPGTANGRIERPGAAHVWRFTAKKGERLVLEVNARRLGSPLDSYLEILDAKGQPLPRATLRCLAKTFTTFRDHDSVGSGIRLETWNDFAINDYVIAGAELLRIFEMPKNPDDDCLFYSVGGKRTGFLDTTPMHHSLGTPMYKVAMHPPGTTFAPNGLPVITLYYRNDDGGPGFDKDSRLFFDPPADGEYQVRVGDSRNQGGANFAYRLTVRPPRPSFTISFDPTGPTVWKGGAVPLSVTASRTDGFSGRIDFRLDNLPPGFSAPPSYIPEEENATSLALWADPTAVSPTAGQPLKVTARATIAGQEVIREASGQLPKVQEPGDIVTTTEQAEVTVQPGKEVRLTVKIERRNGFAGRVPLEVRGLPHGVRVLDIGLNGILVIPSENSRTVVIYAEPWVKPIEHPFVVLARHEGKNSQHAAKSVLLKVR